MKLLLDTNVLIDLVAPRHPYDSDIKKLCVASVFGDVQLWMSAQSYTDAYYILRKHSSEDEVKAALLATLEFFNPCSIFAADVEPALRSVWDDVEDYLIAYSSKRMGAHYLITRDEELRESAPVPAMTPAEFLAMMKEEKGLVYDEIDL